jgi:hypothetical protein
MSDLKALLAKRKADRQAKEAQNIRTVKLQDGKNRIRVLPGWRKDDPTYYHDFGVHWIKAPGESKPQAVYLCVDKTYGRPCPICETIGEGIRNTSDDAVIDALKQSNAAGRVLVNALVKSGAEPETPVVMELPSTVASAIEDTLITYLEDDVNVLDLNEGHDFIIERTGKGIGTRYTVNVSPKASVVDKKVLTSLTNLDQYVAQEQEAKLAKALNAVGSAAGISVASSHLLTGTGGSTAAIEPPVAARAPVTPVADDAPFEAEDEFDDIPIAGAGTAPEPAPAKAAPKAAPAAAVEDDDDMDALLAELDDL